ncbi:hypothetical protein BGZ60DRAFT_421759 [Tricladium varicosporioides]|nr:hypothetical protein BGZ60DRAFT_421759 [Hymenoscyphus varicosporioides]
MIDATRKFCNSLEAERLELFRPSYELTPSRRRSITKGFTIVVQRPGKNQPRKKTYDLLLAAIKHCEKLFLLCACAGQNRLISFCAEIETKLDIAAVLQWWDSVTCPEELEEIRNEISSEFKNVLSVIQSSTPPLLEQNTQLSLPSSPEDLDILQDPEGPQSTISNLQGHDLFPFLTGLACSTVVLSNTWGADPAYSSCTVTKGVTLLVHNNILDLLLEYSRILGRNAAMRDEISVSIYTQDLFNFMRQYKTGCDPLTIQTFPYTLAELPTIPIVYGPSDRIDVSIILERDILFELIKVSSGLQFR